MQRLKIRDDVDLRELEKFGFEYTSESEQIFKLSEYRTDCILIHDRMIIFRVYYGIGLYEDYDLTVLYDLFEAGLVEKVEE